MNNTFARAVACCVTASCFALPAHAQKDSNHVSIGVAAKQDQSIYQGFDDEVSVTPLVKVEYNNFYFGGTDLGYKFINKKPYELHLGIMSNWVAPDRSDSDDLEDMGDVSTAVYGVVGGKFFSPLGMFGVDLMTDISDENDGSMVDVKWGMPFPSTGRLRLRPSIFASWKSEEVVNHHYGVSAEHVRAGRPAYEADAGLVYGVSMMAMYPINRNWMVLGRGKMSFFSNEFTDSPIVDEDSAASVFVGISYRFN